jgi:Holliday junction resolvasome RuvABC endonuclease subunit
MSFRSHLVLGIDGGLAHLGWAVAAVGAEYTRPQIEDGGVVETVKRSIGTSADSHTERALELAVQLDAVVQRWKPSEIVAEAFSPPRDARNASMLAWSWGVICAVARQYGMPIRAKSPCPLKAALTGNRVAKKDEMIEAAAELYPESARLFALLPARNHEHLADAIAAIHYFHARHA